MGRKRQGWLGRWGCRKSDCFQPGLPSSRLFLPAVDEKEKDQDRSGARRTPDSDPQMA